MAPRGRSKNRIWPFKIEEMPSSNHNRLGSESNTRLKMTRSKLRYGTLLRELVFNCSSFTIVLVTIAHLLTVQLGTFCKANKDVVSEHSEVLLGKIWTKLGVEKNADAEAPFSRDKFAYNETDKNLRDRQLRQLLLAHPSRRNEELAERLTRGQLDYQVFYPKREHSLPGTDSNDDNNSKRQASELAAGDLSLIQRAEEDRTATAATKQPKSGSKTNQVLGHYNRSNVVIKAFNYKFRLDLELNNNLFGPGLIQKHFLPKGGQQISTQKIEHCYYHARTQPEARHSAIGAFRTCTGLSGIIHVNNESFVIQPFYDADLSKKHPHIIYRYQSNFIQELRPNEPDQTGTPDADSNGISQQQNRRECGNARLHEWALRQHSKLATFNAIDGRFGRQVATNNCSTTSKNHLNGHEPAGDCDSEPQAQTKFRFIKRDVSLTEKYIELALVLSQDMFDKRNSSSRMEVLQDAIQIVNCLDLYFRFSANTRVALIYIETWAYGDQIDITTDVKQTLYNFLEYTTRKLYKVSMDATHLLTGGHPKHFDASEVGMSIPGSICSSRAVSVSQESSVFEPFITASTIAHMLGHNLGMEHDDAPSEHGKPRAAQPVQEGSMVNSRPAQEILRGTGGISKASLHGSRHQVGQHDPEDHEDEIKSRSLKVSEQSPQLSSILLDETSKSCRSNCIMNAHFAYLQPPVTIGNMIQQQVASNHNNLNATSSTQEQNQQQPDWDSSESELASNLPFRFSRQSIESYHNLLRLGHGICLFNKPNQLEDFKACGNGIVDKGEDCDCGTFHECLENDSCCDPVTCRFKANAECIHGACCDRCKLRPKGFVCRRARGECDLAEVCDGKSGQCAPDVYKQNGFPCSAATGYCYLGQCPQHELQCADLWGSDSKVSNPICFSTFNSNGTIRGNCGYDTTLRKYRRCELEHVMCGTLQCQLGDMKPATASLDSPSAHEFSKKTIHGHDGTHHECKVITGPVGQANSISYVRDGSKCSENRVCFNQTCQPLELVYRDAFELCPRDSKGHQCSGNGICSTANRCQCDLDWTGHDCSQYSQTTEQLKVPSNVVAQPNDLLLKPPFNLNASSTHSLESFLTSGPLNLPNQRSLPLSSQSIVIVAQTVQPSLPVIKSEIETEPTINTTALAPVESSPTPVSDKKKSEGRGVLVVILVSIVAAVYVGFALMANCYRRKGLIRPDKVLRHHQMNCKLDQIRTSFIAKRLAQAEGNLIDGSQIPNCGPSTSLGTGSGSQSNGIDLMNPYVSSLSGQPAYQHQLGAIYNSAGIDLQLPGLGYSTNPDLFVQSPPSIRLHPSRPPESRQFEQCLDNRSHLDPCIHRRGPSEPFLFEPDTSDHIPLLTGAPTLAKHTNSNQRLVNQLMMRSFNPSNRLPNCKNNLIYQDHWSSISRTGLGQQVIRGARTPSRRPDRSSSDLYRATSLCSVNSKLAKQDGDTVRQYDEEFPPLPPSLPPSPPPPPSQNQLNDDSQVDAESEDSEPANTSGSLKRQRSSRRRSEPTLAKSPVNSSWSMRTMKVPLNNGESSSSEQLSLLTQLQKMEQAQTLHQRHAVSDKKLNTNDGLGEFLSLPLSVQLSSLLALSLRDTTQTSTSIDNYVQTLNSSSATTSLHGTPGKDHLAGSRVGTLKRQQMKLHNLQGLINKLQRLRNQTMDEMDGADF